MSTIINIILFILLLIIIVSIHEFGHFIAAKAFNVYVPEFSIGMGKSLFQHKFKETTFSIRCLPIGGYCAIAQDEETVDETTDVEMIKVDKSRTMSGISKIKKIIILLAGVFMNVVLAVVIMSMVYLSIGQTHESPRAIVNEVTENSPAEKAGLQKDDEIIKVTFENGYSISPSTFSDVSDFMSLYESGEVTFTIKRADETISVKITPEKSDERYIIGIQAYDSTIVSINFFNCWKYGCQYLTEITKLLWTTILGLFRGVGLNNISGPVGMYSATSQAISLGSVYYFVYIAMFSLNIGIFNLIPIPALDGGRVVLTLIEAIIRRPISKRVEEYIMAASVILFLLIFVFATGQDIIKLFK